MRLVGVVLVLLVVVAACGADDEDPAPETTIPIARSTEGASTATTVTGAAESGNRPYDVSTSIVTLVDGSRATPATGGAPERAERELVTHLTEPQGEGPFPLIVFAHGLNGHPRKFTILHEAWAEAGYVVAAPTFPVSNDRAPGGGQVVDLPQQPGDMSFVLDELLGPDSPLTAEVDADIVVAAGLSLGGGTVYGMVYDDCCRDDRIVAAMVLDGNELSFEVDLTDGPPLLIVHADEDPALPYTAAAASYAKATVPTGFLTLHAFTHAAPFENDIDPTDEVVNDVLLAWLDGRTGEGEESAVVRIDAAVAAAGDLASYQRKS